MSVELMAEARRERAAVESGEGQALLAKVIGAVGAYSSFLDRQGLIWSGGRLKADALVVALDYGAGGNPIDVALKGGALDRVYGDGVNPDPFGRGPADIPHKPRGD
jgi:hypothetical protein